MTKENTKYDIEIPDHSLDGLRLSEEGGHQNAVIHLILNHPEVVADRGLYLSGHLRNDNLSTTVASLVFKGKIHVGISGDADTYFVLEDGGASRYNREEYVRTYGLVCETPLSSSLRAIKGYLDQEGEKPDWAYSPALVIGQFERVGSSWLMDIMNQIGRSQVEPLRQHVSALSPFSSFSIDYDDESSHHLNFETLDLPFPQIWFRNFIAAQYQSDLQVVKETNLFFKLPLFVNLFPENTPIILLRRDIRGIIASFKKGSLFERWEYQKRFGQIKQIISENSKLDRFQPLVDSTDEENWLDVLITLYVINVSQIIEHISANQERSNVIEINYEQLVERRDDQIDRICSLLQVTRPPVLNQYRSASDSDTEFNTNKSKSNSDDWVEVLSDDERTFIEKRVRQRLADIEKHWGSKLAQEFASQGFVLPNNSTLKTKQLEVKPVKEIKLRNVDQNKRAIESETVFRKIDGNDHVGSFGLAQNLVSNSQFAVFLEDMRRERITNDQDGNYLFFNPNITANRGGRLFLDEEEYKVLGGYENHPVCWVSWVGATSYAQWLGCSLPTLEQWRRVSDLSEPSEHRNSDNLIGDTTPVDRYPQNNLGIHDFKGNLKIWTTNWHPKIPESQLSTGLSMITVGHAWNTRADKEDVTYKPFLLSSSTLGIRLINDPSIAEVNIVKKLSGLLSSLRQPGLMKEDILDINLEIFNSLQSS